MSGNKFLMNEWNLSEHAKRRFDSETIQDFTQSIPAVERFNEAEEHGF